MRLALVPASFRLIKGYNQVMLETDQGPLPIGPTRQISPHVQEGMERQPLPVDGIIAVHLDSIQMLTAPVELPAHMVGVVVDLPVDLAMVNGGTANISLVQLIHVLSVSFLASLTIPQSCKPESIFPTTMTYLSKHLATTPLIPFYSSPTRLWTITYSRISSLLVIRHQRPCRNIPFLSLWVVEI